MGAEANAARLLSMEAEAKLLHADWSDEAAAVADEPAQTEAFPVSPLGSARAPVPTRLRLAVAAAVVGVFVFVSLAQWGWAKRGGGAQLFLEAGQEGSSQQLNAVHKKQPSLYCFMFMLGYGNEADLTALQHRHHWGIFACDQHAVFSSQTKVIHGVHTIGVGHNPTYIHPVNKRAMNSGILKKCWRHVIHAGQYKKHDWTVKVDADAVFFPGWLKHKLAAPLYRGLAHHPTWLRNVHTGRWFELCGPIEVVSRVAMKHLALHGWDKQGKCLKKNKGESEDVWLQRCLQYRLHLKGYFMPNLLKTWGATNDVEKCWGGTVATHAFKEPWAFEQCHNRALTHWR